MVLIRALGTLTLVSLLAVGFPGGAVAEQAAEPDSAAAGRLDAGQHHTCAVLSGGSVRCWGFSREGELGYANTGTIGDDEAPASAGPVYLGPGRTARAISAGDYHTCALLDDATVRCWGFGANGRLGSGADANIGDDETPGSRPPVNFGAGRTVKALSAGGAHTCAILDDDSLRCWGFGFDGRLGYGNMDDVLSPSAVGAVDLGAGHTAKAVSAGNFHTCALLEDSTVRCWGSGLVGQLGYGDALSIGVTQTPAAAGPVDLGSGHTAKAISAGGAETCAVLDDGTVRCWGFGRDGRLGYGNTQNVGDNEAPGTVGPVNLGSGRTATAVSVGAGSVCARLDGAALRCWGYGADGRLGYGGTDSIGDDEVPGSAGPVDLGSGRTATAVTLGGGQTCARLDNQSVRCWGYGGNGRLGLCSERNIGDDETPAAVAPVPFGDPGIAGASCPPSPTGPPTYGAPKAAPDPRAAEARRALSLRRCLATARRHARAERRRARRGSPQARARARRHLRRHYKRARRRCLKRYGRTPGRVRRLVARATSRHRVVLRWDAPGSDGSRPPAARTYVVKQSVHAIGSSRAFKRAPALCKGSCRFPSTTDVGARLALEVTDLRPHTTYFYVVAARDNVSHRVGPRSRMVRVRTR